MEEFQKRMVLEFAELSDKLTKLRAYLGCTASAQIEKVHRMMLVEQMDAMESYAQILKARLTVFGIEITKELTDMATSHSPARAVQLIRELHPKNDDATYRDAVQEIVANVR